MERTDPTRDDAFLLEGNGAALEPQEAELWAVGFEIKPVNALAGLTVHANYYEIDFTNLLGAPNPTEGTAVLLNPDKFVFEPTDEEYAAFVGAVENPESAAGTSASDIGVIVDRRIANSEEAELEGIDFGVRYIHDTAIGIMSYGVSGNKQLNFDLTQSGTVVDQLAYLPDLFVAGNIGWAKDNMRARLTLNYTDGYDADPSIGINQSSVDSFLVTNLFIGYDFDASSGVAEGLSLRFNVDNVFDEDPPEYRRNRGINYSGFTLNRIYRLGLSYAF